MPKIDDPGMVAFQAWLEDPVTGTISLAGATFPDYSMPTGWTYQPQVQVPPVPPTLASARPSGFEMVPPGPVAGDVGTEIIATQPISGTTTLPIGDVGPPQPPPVVAPPPAPPSPPASVEFSDPFIGTGDAVPIPSTYMPEGYVAPRTGPRLVPQVNIPLVLNTGDFGDPAAPAVPFVPTPVPGAPGGGGGGAATEDASDAIPVPPKDLMWWGPSALHPQLAPWGSYLREMLSSAPEGQDVPSPFALDTEIDELMPPEQEAGAPGYMSTRDVIAELRGSMNITQVEGETPTAQWQRVINALPSADLRTRQLLSSLRMTPEGKWFTEQTELLQNPRYL